jgi:hypothetical protein
MPGQKKESLRGMRRALLLSRKTHVRKVLLTGLTMLNSRIPAHTILTVKRHEFFGIYQIGSFIFLVKR